MNPQSIQVKVIYTEGCANTPPTIQRVEEVARKMGIGIVLTTVRIATQDEAEAHRFQGSPTVLVGGLDVDPAMREGRSFGFT